MSVTGITPMECYPPRASIKNCKQNIKSLKLYVPCQKPDIESINDIKVCISIEDYKMVKTIIGIKLLLNIACNIKVIYTALNEEQSVHSAHWDISFCDFMLAEKCCTYKCSCYNPNLFIGLEDAYVSWFDEKSIDLSLLYIICNSLPYDDYYNRHKCHNVRSDCQIEEKEVYVPDPCPQKENNYSTYYCAVDYYDKTDKLTRK